MDNLFLAKILKEHARLIIPGFGAFLRKEGVSAGLIFSPFLKKDDGVLGALLCQEYGVSNFDGEGMIAEWVQHIREALAATGKYHIDGVGLLMLDANGAIAMVEEPVRKPVQQVQVAAVAQANPVLPRPLVQAETVATSHELAPPVAAPISQPVAPNREFAQPVAAPISQPVAPSREFAQPVAAPISQPVAPNREFAQPVAAPNSGAAATIAQQIVEQIQQAPSRPLIAPQPVGQAVPRVAPRPMSVAPQGVAPRPAVPGSPNMQRSGMPPQPPQGAGVQQQAGSARTQQNLQGGQPRQQGEGGQQQRGDRQRPQGAAAQQQRPQRPGQRPPQRPKKSKKFSSTEIWLIVAIVAALAVAAIIVWSLLVLSSPKQFYSPENAVDSITVVDSLTVTQE